MNMCRWRHQHTIRREIKVKIRHFKQKILMLLLFLFISLQILWAYAFASTQTSFFEAPPIITLKALKEKLDQNAGVVIVDVRGDFSFERERIKGAISIPLAEMEARYKELPKGKTIVFY
ncbi:TPA: rhodanese-like domain-containing protein [Candidatus Poribacteria bacterium]|nr:rhodanese-like domain-containing protein [Candidatus Poribacteria bacterium]